MTGATNLNLLLKSMHPVLEDGVYVFHSSERSFEDVLAFNPVLIFREKEGTALILKQEHAEAHDLDYLYPSRMITLNVHSSLEAVGFLAAITKKLAEDGISVNPVSAYYHDHLFVPVHKADKTLDILQAMSRTPPGCE